MTSNKLIKDGAMRFGEGNISGYIACLLGFLCFLGVLAFHFPQYLTTPELRQNYDVDFLRTLMLVCLTIAGSFGLLNFHAFPSRAACPLCCRSFPSLTIDVWHVFQKICHVICKCFCMFYLCMFVLTFVIPLPRPSSIHTDASCV